ncbi:hypothetical protein SELMODRAFT_451523 [Selaginella moellendorffii]|uniref:Uncharacterized protein RBR2-2 n=1 Tax=Selaginella moellendorffii TaxID=88036 RepID=D8T074_SELML|nr:retinoblastoma-related protein isoform X1 [Selaginella moellendorffii]EFJ10031.1 hypothetical protein SELMODRAFT_451523 [Selaginella moellendorffii]|eukprot:XP_002989002.1 retinoblastoma-related protein isoform X1 [Selaginella moellendorffii]
MAGDEKDRSIVPFSRAALDGEARFRQCCEARLALDEIRMEKAVALFRAITSLKDSSVLGGSADEAERIWMACILYVLKKLDRNETHTFTVSQVLRATNVSIVEFFRELPQFLEKCTATLNDLYGVEFQEHLQAKEDQATFVHLMVLFNHYNRNYLDYFKPQMLSDGTSTGQQHFGWFFFLAVRMRVLGQFPDLVTCTNALLGVIVVMIVHMPVSLRSFSLENTSLFPKRDDKGVNLVASISSVGDACEGDVMSMLQKIQEMIPTVFPSLSGIGDSSAVSNLQGFNCDGILYFEGLLEDHMLATHLQILERLCEVVEGGTVKMPTPSSSEAVRMPPPTPVSVTMTTAKWLRTVIAPLPAEPSTELLDYLKSCDRDITEEVTHRGKALLEAIFPVYPQGSWRATLHSSGSSEWTVQRRSEASKLYYRVLTALCRAEFLRLQSKNLTSVLTSEKFHRCMLACSAELVLAAHKTIILAFPAVLEPTGITAFDLSKVIESFVRHEPTLPRELKRHLNSIEERLLESMAWEKGSSMYNSLVVAKPRFAPDIRRLELISEPLRTLEPLIPSYSQGGTSKGEDMAAESNSPTEAMHEIVMVVFFQKVLKLAASRIKVLCERLMQPSFVVEHIFQVVEYALNRTTIFFNRHIDQILLCSTYGVCKVLSLNVSFKDIIFQYRKQPQSRNHVFKSVYLKHRGGIAETGDIIKFYNTVFVPAVKSFLVTIAPPSVSMTASQSDVADENTAPNSPARPSVLPAIPDMSPRKVSARHNVYVSPLRNTKVENIMSPHSKSLYACVGESTHAYQSPSKDLTAINCRLNSSNGRRLDFLGPSMISDSFVSGALTNNSEAAANAPNNDANVDQGVPNDNQSPIPDPQSPPGKRPRLE